MFLEYKIYYKVFVASYIQNDWNQYISFASNASNKLTQ